MALPDLGYRGCGTIWLKPVEVHDTVVSGDKVVKVDAFMLLAATADAMDFYVHDGSRRVHDAIGTDVSVMAFERYCLSIKHWFYIRPQIRQFQDAVKAWVQSQDPTVLTFITGKGSAT